MPYQVGGNQDFDVAVAKSLQGCLSLLLVLARVQGDTTTL
jgi:hypothetical protein